MPRHLIGICAAFLALSGAAAAQSSSVSWADERLTVHAVDAPLSELVAEVAAKTGLTVVGTTRLQGRRSLDLADATLPEALPRLLDGVNYLVTRHDGSFQVTIHSMRSSGGAENVETGPLYVPGLTDLIVGAQQGQNTEVEFEEIDDDEQEELDELEELGRTKGAASLRRLLRTMRSDFFGVRVRAVQLLAEYTEPAALAAIVDALGDEDADVSVVASDALAEMPGKAVVTALFQQLARDVEVDVQGGALRSVALRADLATIPLLSKALPDIHPQLQELAAEMLRKLEARAKALAGTRPAP